MSGVCGLLSGVFGLMSGVCGLLSGVFGLMSGVCGLLSGVFGLMSGVCGLLSGVFGLMSGVWCLTSAFGSKIFVVFIGFCRARCYAYMASVYGDRRLCVRIVSGAFIFPQINWRTHAGFCYRRY